MNRTERPSNHRRLDIAVIGSGISGLSAAWLLAQRHSVTVFERADRLGGHTNTVDVATPSGVVPVDTGFIVFNTKTYPNLTALFTHLGVETRPSDMSLAVSLRGGTCEYSGSSILTLFAHGRNAVRPGFWLMLRDLLRFYRAAPADLAHLDDRTTLRQYLDRKGYGCRFRDDHLFPMAGAIWSAPQDAIADFPAKAFIRFNLNHGLLQLRGRPVWRSVIGGSRSYIGPLTAPFARAVHLNADVSVARGDGCVEVRAKDGSTRRFDHAVIATHADQALALIADADSRERDLLGAFRYTRSVAVLHQDDGLMPRRRRLWSSWNCLAGDRGDARSAVTYWMNRLQGIPTGTPLFVSLNPPRPPRPGRLISAESYDHPLFDAAAMAAQRRLWTLQGRRRTWFCGAYFGYGFHEDGLQAGLAVAEALGGVRRPWTVANDLSRIHVGGAEAALTLAGSR